MRPSLGEAFAVRDGTLLPSSGDNWPESSACGALGGAAASTLATLASPKISLRDFRTVLCRTKATSVSMSILPSSRTSGSASPTSKLNCSSLPSLLVRSKSRRTSLPPSTEANSSCSRPEVLGIPPGAATISRSAIDFSPSLSCRRLTHRRLVAPGTSATRRPFAKTLRYLSTKTCHCGDPVSAALSPVVSDVGGLRGLLAGFGGGFAPVTIPGELEYSLCGRAVRSKLSGTPYSQMSLPAKPAATSSPRSLVAGKVDGISLRFTLVAELLWGLGPVK